MIRSTRIQVALGVTGGLLLLVASVVVSTARGVLDRDQFATRLARSLGDERVASYVAEQAVNGLLEVKPNLIGVRPILESSVREVVETAPFRAVVRSSARTAHYSLFESSGGQRAVLVLPDLAVLLRGALTQGNPALAEKIPESLETALASDAAQRAFTAFIEFWRVAKKLLLACWVLAFIGIALLLSSIAVAPDRRRGLVFAGGVLAASGIGIFAMLPLGRIVPLALTDEPALRGAMTGLWLAYFAGLRWLALVFAGTGLVFTAAGTTVLETANPITYARRQWTRVAAPNASAGMRLARGAVLLVLGGSAVAAPMFTLAGLGVMAGVAFVYLGLLEVFRILLPIVEGDTAPIVGGLGHNAVMLGGTLATVVVLLGGAAYFATHREELVLAVQGTVSECNGSARLCDKTVDQVVFPGAHNAMSNADIDQFLFPNHRHKIRRMLDEGIRMLAIDVHYGVPTAGRVRTDLDREQMSFQKIEEQLGPEATAAAIRIRNELTGKDEGESGLYFCHGFCELGSYEMGPTFRDIRDFLVANPGEVVVLIIEDYVQPLDLAKEFTSSHLADFAYMGPVKPWPTLRQLVDDNTRLIVFTESGRPGVPWMHPSLESIQETPYTFLKQDDFSCTPNRGGTAGSLFQVNHWIQTLPAPLPTNAEIVNAYDFLLARARECMRVRKHVPNFISVDFYDIGDVVRVARTLNDEHTATAPVRRAR